MVGLFLYVPPTNGRGIWDAAITGEIVPPTLRAKRAADDTGERMGKMDKELADVLGEDFVVGDEEETVEEETLTTGDESEESETETEEETETEPTPEERYSAMEERLAKYEEENKAFQRAMLDERKKRQTEAEEHGRLKTSVQEILAAVKARKEAAAAPEPEFIKLQYDDDGNPVIPKDVLTGLAREQAEARVKPLEENVGQLTQSQQAVRDQRAQEDAFNRAVSQIVSEDESFKPAHAELDKAFGWLNQKVDEIQRAEGIEGVIQPGPALSLLAKHGALEEFKKVFPDKSASLVARAYESDFDLREALRSFAVTPVAKPDPKTVKKISQKPASLASVGNRKGIETSAADQVIEFSVEDLLELSISDPKKYTALMKQASKELRSEE